MNCEHCGKHLSRKRARQIDGVIMCSPCMFAPRKGLAPERRRPAGPVGEADAP